MKRTSRPAPAADAPGDPNPSRDTPYFEPAPVRYRYDGWTPDRQLAFIEALADCGCVETAARAVGMSTTSAYALRRRKDAQGFRHAWDAAAETAITCLADSAMARAIHGIVVPVFYQGEQVGERRYFNERLTMFLLRYRAPHRYGKWLDSMEARQPVDGPSSILAFRIERMLRAAWRAIEAAFRGEEPPPVEEEYTPDTPPEKEPEKSPDDEPK